MIFPPDCVFDHGGSQDCMHTGHLHTHCHLQGERIGKPPHFSLKGQTLRSILQWDDAKNVFISPHCKVWVLTERNNSGWIVWWKLASELVSVFPLHPCKVWGLGEGSKNSNKNRFRVLLIIYNKTSIRV